MDTLGSAILLLTITASVVGTYIQETFTDATNNGNFNHLIRDVNTGKLYLGAVNRIYKLTETLGQDTAITTGPQSDSPNCHPTQDCTCEGVSNCEDYIRRPTDSINKGMVIDYASGNLIVCTNLFQGKCEKRHLGNLQTLETPIEQIILVPSDEESPVVMFIAPGPPDASKDRVFYVAATRSTVGLDVYNDQLPAITSRNLETFELAYSDLVSHSKKEFEQQQKDQFRVEYIAGFSSGGFSYFLAVQRESVAMDVDYVTRILRVCQNDKNYYSYTEVPLRCSYLGTDYNILRAAYVTHPGSDLALSLGLSNLPPPTDMEHVLFAVFSKSRQKSPEPTADSVLCVYPLKSIRRIFTETIQDCFAGVGNIGPAHIVVPSSCVRTELPIEDNYCGKYEFNTPISGTTAVSAEALLHFPETSVTSLAVMVIHDYTVAFVGTDNGTVKKVVVESMHEATEYESMTVDSGTVVKDMAFDRSSTHLYAMTDKKLTRIKVQECSQYQGCSDCLGAKDPFCGWCSLDNKCSIRADCPNSDSPRRWLPYSGDQCTKITGVAPDKVQIKPNAISLLLLTIQNLPSLTNGGYQCAFSGYGVMRTTAGRVVNDLGLDQQNEPNKIQCETPFPNLLPTIPTGKDHIVMKLSVRMNNRDFVAKNFTFFDCRLHTSCTGCTESDFPCTWCVKSHVCTDNQENCLNDVLITGKNVKGASDRPGPLFCPRIESSFTEILVPSRTTKEVSVKALNLQDFQSDFKCHFDIDNGLEVEAIRTQGTDFIKCASVNFQYRGQAPHRNVRFHITWGERPLDNPDRIQVKVYKCAAMANNCGTCLTMDPKYDCGWCDKTCSIQQQCTASRWLNHSQICPDPIINLFTPTTGPKDGGTLITIEGVNLGKVFEDIKDGVIVAGIPCAVTKEQYSPAERIVCMTGPSKRTGSGPVKVIVNNRFPGDSDAKFYYVDPSIDDFYPKKGPVSGGTRLTVIGDHMDAGTSISASVSGLPCEILSTTRSSAVCITSMSPSPIDGRVQIHFDRATKVYTEYNFHYTPDPVITEVYPEKGIVSGGLRITVFGSNLDTVQEPKMYLKLRGGEYSSDCQVMTAIEMVCMSPSIVGAISSGILNQPLIVPYGFIMDNVTALKNLTAYDDRRAIFRFYPDPTFESFEEGVKYFQNKNEYLTINGENLNLALSQDDVTVTVGSAFCNVTSIADKQLTCRPPSPSTDGVGNSPRVAVQVGKNLTFSIGVLHYEGAQNRLSVPTMIGIGAGGGILIFIIILVCIAYHRKSRESDRVMKRMQNQMDVLEARVAKECKEAFAELQTDMTEIKSDLSGPSGIPFRDYRSFCMKVLFPNVHENDHPVTRPLELDLTRNEGLDRGLRQFNTLINNKTFLLLFIRTLETNKDFSMMMRVDVASLISVALQNRMEYYTDILKTLLAELIERAMEGRNHPKLLLRRTESIAEKMLTNWFTFLLYKFLKECAGEPLFMLYRAIKQQVDKGPVDAVTSEAKYSLSEDKLIRQQIDYKSLTIRVMVPDAQYGNQEHAVKVLDCDTISQVKEKMLDAIYKNSAFTTRPGKDDLDLEWRTGIKGRLILQDEDVTTKQDSEFKRLNTLGHYRVLDGAEMALVQRQSSMYNLSLGSNRSGGSHHRFDVYLSSSPSLHRSLSPNNIHIDMEEKDSKYYHLVKQHDSDVHKEGDRGSKMVSEIYLTRLLATKGTLQQFVDDLFETIFSTANRGYVLPLAIKYMFDFLDDQALHHGINDLEVVHTWKSNSLPLRFWINVVKNPDFVFNIHKTNIVDSCLSVTAQTFMDSCSMSEHRLGKDSPSSKLLYAKDIPKYKKWVERYYQDIKLMPAISDQDMNAMLCDESRSHVREFNLSASLYELYQYVVRYNDELMTTLEDDEFARNYRLAHKLEQVHNLMDSDA